MKIEIDQSNKVEQTVGDTYIGDSFGNVVILNARDKRMIQSIYRQIGRPRMYLVEVFSALTAILISISHDATHIYIVDLEYPGKSNIIENLVISYLKILGKESNTDQIRFAKIGKSSRAHLVASRKKSHLIETTARQVSANEVLLLTNLSTI